VAVVLDFAGKFPGVLLTRVYPVCAVDLLVSQPQSKQNSLDGKANLIMMITYLTAGCISPILGGVIDRIGRRGIMNLVSAVLVVLVHILLRNTDMYPIFPLVLLGFCYSIYASALWPSIALVIAKESVATAYGVVTAVQVCVAWCCRSSTGLMPMLNAFAQNIGLGFAPMIVGALQPAAHDVSKGAYDKVELFFIILGAFGILFGLWLNYEDRMRPYPVLNMPESKIAELVEQIGDIGKLASRRPKKGELADTEALTSALLDPMATPTFYEVRCALAFVVAVGSGRHGACVSCDDVNAALWRCDHY
jgi:MFS family permease